MADITPPLQYSGGSAGVISAAPQRFKDMGDGTWSPVVVLGAVAGAASYPVGSTPTNNASGNVANASAVATLAGVAAKTTYLSGFEVTGAGATAASVVLVTVAGIVGGTATYVLSVAAGATLGNTPMSYAFNPPLSASAVNTAIVVTVPALGVGNTNSAVAAHGFQLLFRHPTSRGPTRCSGTAQ